MGRKNKNKNGVLTQEEIWDDSALIESWDEALEEYKRYHSIHAKGEDMEEILRQAEAEDELAVPVHVSGHEAVAGRNIDPDVDAKMMDANQDDSHVETASKSEAALESDQLNGDTAPAISAQPSADTSSVNHQAGPATNLPTMPVPEHLLATVGTQDETVKNLMMAWYYTGYYTGLYEGQQRANGSNPS